MTPNLRYSDGPLSQLIFSIINVNFMGPPDVALPL